MSLGPKREHLTASQNAKSLVCARPLPWFSKTCFLKSGNTSARSRAELTVALLIMIRYVTSTIRRLAFSLLSSIFPGVDLRIACHSTVNPFSDLAPRLRSHSTRSRAALLAAESRGVNPSYPIQFKSAPRPRRYSAAVRWPP
jgi:hypothetical protein